MTPLVKALAAYRSKAGHWPGCQHRYWLGNDRHLPGIECPADRSCDGTGAGCGQRCRAAYLALHADLGPLFGAAHTQEGAA